MDEQRTWDYRFYRVVEYASAGVRNTALEPGSIFASLSDLKVIEPSDDEDAIHESFNAMTKMLNKSAHFET